MAVLIGNAFMLMGLPASGKTTLGRAIVKSLPAFRLLTTDEIRRESNLPQKDPDEGITAQIYENMAMKAISLCELGIIPILDATFYKRKFRQSVYTSLKNIVTDLFLIINEADKRICEERVRRRKDHLGFNYAGVDDLSVFLDLLRTFEPLDNLELSNFTGWLRVSSDSIPRKILDTGGVFPDIVRDTISQDDIL
jgi:predicted kinase